MTSRLAELDAPRIARHQHTRPRWTAAGAPASARTRDSAAAGNRPLQPHAAPPCLHASRPLSVRAEAVHHPSSTTVLVFALLPSAQPSPLVSPAVALGLQLSLDVCDTPRGPRAPQLSQAAPVLLLHVHLSAPSPSPPPPPLPPTNLSPLIERSPQAGLRQLIRSVANQVHGTGGVVRDLRALGAGLTLPYRMKRNQQFHERGDHFTMSFDTSPVVLKRINETLRRDPMVVRWMLTKKGAAV
ncbi:mitochondrial 37S ribosomal protein bS6m [Cutaneotrichosporon oleaginosum]|uniref:mitochondrial 37S ribosomal protein bS6m n=1 Tax=Cutaneotrichosporon oleaginosum TaxID=879819 RepID=UPI0013225B18|nr:hypothetical protein COLE_07676 [Cutaneotrichosporon oleaginosum]